MSKKFSSFYKKTFEKHNLEENVKTQNSIILVILALLTLSTGCSVAHIRGEGYTYKGIAFENPVEIANAHAIATDAKTRADIATGNLEIQRLHADNALELQRQMVECAKADNANCVNALSILGFGLNGFGYMGQISGLNGWGWSSMRFPQHLQSDATFYNQ